MNKTTIAAVAGAAGFIAGGIKPGMKLIHQHHVARAAFKGLVDQRLRIIELEQDLDAIRNEAITETEYLRRELGKARAAGYTDFVTDDELHQLFDHGDAA